MTSFRSFCIFIAALGMLYSIAALSVTAFDLPDIGDSAGSVVSPEYERRLGQAFLRQVRRHANIVTDPEIEQYINSLGSRLVSHTGDNAQPFSFFAVLDSTINAFAGPGGVIGINTGVILNSRGESELAAVMAHEIAHVTQRHLARSLERLNRSKLPMFAALLGAVLVGIQNPNAGVAALTAATGVNVQNQINFTRVNEQEADRIGMQLLVRAQYDPRGMPGFFERLQQSSQYHHSNAPEFLRTHPLTTSRIADTRARAEIYPKAEYPDSEEYGLVRAKIEVLSRKSADDLVKSYAYKLKQTQARDADEKSLRYGYALALTSQGDFDEAHRQLAYLLTRDSDNVHYMLASGGVEAARKNYRLANTIYQKAYTLYPRYRPLVFAYSKFLLDYHNPEEARNILRRYRGQHDHEADPIFHDLLAQAETQSGHDAEGAIAKAEYHYLVGATRSAIDKLKFTENRFKLSDYQLQRVTARRVQLEYELELEKQLGLR